MKMYKRILAFALAVLFVLAVCACSPAEKPVDLNNPEGGQTIGDQKTQRNDKDDDGTPNSSVQDGSNKENGSGDEEGTNKSDENKTGGSRREDPVQDKYECSGFNVTHVRVQYAKSEPLTAIVTSVGELNEFLSKYPGKTNIRIYDEEFFKTNALVVMISTFTSGSVSQKVVEVDASDAGEMKVYITTKIPEIGTTDMAAWLVGIAIPKTEYKGQTELVIIEK